MELFVFTYFIKQSLGFFLNFDLTLLGVEGGKEFDVLSRGKGKAIQYGCHTRHFRALEK